MLGGVLAAISVGVWQWSTPGGACLLVIAIVLLFPEAIVVLRVWDHGLRHAFGRLRTGLQTFGQLLCRTYARLVLLLIRPAVDLYCSRRGPESHTAPAEPTADAPDYAISFAPTGKDLRFADSNTATDASPGDRPAAYNVAPPKKLVEAFDKRGPSPELQYAWLDSKSVALVLAANRISCTELHMRVWDSLTNSWQTMPDLVGGIGRSVPPNVIESSLEDLLVAGLVRCVGKGAGSSWKRNQ